MIERTCERCGAEFRCWPSHKKRYCSKTCRYTARREAIPMHPGGWHFYGGQWWYHQENTPRRRGHLRACVGCGKEFPARSSRRPKFCSHACLQSQNIKPPGTISREGGYLSEYVKPDDPFEAPAEVSRHH